MNEHLLPARRELQQNALKNPCLTQAALDAAVTNLKFHQLLGFNQQVSLSILMTVSPSDDPKFAPYWHVSAAFINAFSGKPKIYQSLNTNERQTLLNVVRFFLEGVGDKEARVIYLNTETAFHGHRDLSFEEIMQIAITGNRLRDSS